MNTRYTWHHVIVSDKCHQGARKYRNKKWQKIHYLNIVQKKGNLKSCTNYRTIALISHASKVLLRIIQNRIVTSTAPVEQAGFRKWRPDCQSMMGNWEKSDEYGNTLYMCFVDYEKAFNCINLSQLRNTLRMMASLNLSQYP